MGTHIKTATTIPSYLTTSKSRHYASISPHIVTELETVWMLDLSKGSERTRLQRSFDLRRKALTLREQRERDQFPKRS